MSLYTWLQKMPVCCEEIVGCCNDVCCVWNISSWINYFSYHWCI